MKLKPYMVKNIIMCNWCRKVSTHDDVVVYYDNNWYCCNKCKNSYIRYFKRMEKKYKDII